MTRLALLLLLVAACERASDVAPSLEASLGVPKPHVGQRSVGTTRLETTVYGVGGTALVEQTDYETTAVDGIRIAGERIHVDRDEHIVNGRTQSPRYGTYVLTGTKDHPELAKLDGPMMPGEAARIIELYSRSLEDPAKAMPLLTHVFHVGEHYRVPPGGEVVFGARDGATVDLVVLAITPQELSFHVVTATRFPPAGPHDLLSSDCTGTYTTSRLTSSGSASLTCELEDATPHHAHGRFDHVWSELPDSAPAM